MGSGGQTMGHPLLPAQVCEQGPGLDVNQLFHMGCQHCKPWLNMLHHSPWELLFKGRISVSQCILRILTDLKPDGYVDWTHHTLSALLVGRGRSQIRRWAFSENKKHYSCAASVECHMASLAQRMHFQNCMWGAVCLVGRRGSQVCWVICSGTLVSGDTAALEPHQLVSSPFRWAVFKFSEYIKF